MTKKLQIVRVDNDLVQKANLLIGNNIIGRGAATGVSYLTDFFLRRYSINAVLLERHFAWKYYSRTNEEFLLRQTIPQPLIVRNMA